HYFQRYDLSLREQAGAPLGNSTLKKSRVNTKATMTVGKKRPTLDRMFASTSQRNDDGLRASYNISLLIAKSEKPHTIGEKLILPAVEEVLKTVLHKPASDIIKRIPLSNNTVERRIDEMSSDIESFLCNYLQTTHFPIQLDESTLLDNAALLLAYVRFIMNQEIYEELLFARTLTTDTKGESIFHVLKDYFIEKAIPLSNIISVATDGAPAMWRTPSSNGAGSGMSGKNKPPDIERRCEVCDEEIRKEGAKVMCSNVSCGITLHQKCFASIAKVIKLDKAEWLCKNCDEESDSSINTVITSDGDLSRELTTVKHDVQILTDLVNELKRANEILLDKIEQLTVNKPPGVQTPYQIRNPISYSQAVSTNVKNETKSVLVITSKSDKETNMDVLKNIKANVNPATEKISISSTKLVKQGMLVKCANDESLQKLKAIVEEKFSRQYKITTPKSFKPRVLVSDVDKSLDNNDDFIQSLVQNNTFLVDCDIKIITMLKLKYSLSYVIEVDPELKASPEPFATEPFAAKPSDQKIRLNVLALLSVRVCARCTNRKQFLISICENNNGARKTKLVKGGEL
ncbi:unnamed protein product, partial [Acanthoscelides obtectus]